MVKKLNAEVGKEVEIRGKKYEVVGINNKTFTAPDTSATVSLADGQQIVFDDLPELVRSSVDSSQIVSGFIVYPEEGVDPNALADKIKNEVKGVQATGPKQFQEQVVNAVKMFNSIIYGIAIISLLVGSLSIINTMTMSVSERTKEIGIKKAVGAKTSAILSEYMTEAGIIGFLGGLMGVGFGALVVMAINTAMEKSSNDILFLLTPRLVLIAMVFSIALGVIAGIFPAVHATRISIVKALREE